MFILSYINIQQTIIIQLTMFCFHFIILLRIFVVVIIIKYYLLDQH
jgi:hypothetical protein